MKSKIETLHFMTESLVLRPLQILYPKDELDEKQDNKLQLLYKNGTLG